MKVDINYKKFGADLINTFDLDPIYPMAAMSIGDERVMKRFLLAYWCYYDAGVSAYVAEQPSKDFYRIMLHGLGTWPRGMERRHFRGEQAARALDGLLAYGGPEKVVDAMTQHRTFQGISRAVQAFTGFGPWISWKIADMAERVLQYPIKFNDANLGIYKDPRQGAAFILTGDKTYKIADEQLDDVVKFMLVDFQHFKAPPYNDRPVNVQEIETILCKYKAHCYGHYPMGNDSYHVEKSLNGWGDLSVQMLKNVKCCCGYLKG